jgi:exodeoxyribonuclease V gamma subunit
VLHIHRAERSDRLVAALADVLAAPSGDPFRPEVVAVPTRGVERWLAQQLAGRLGTAPGRADGVCAGIEFPFPHHLVGEAVTTATGVDPDTDPWRAERLVWPLLEVVESALDEEWLATLAAHLGAATSTGSRTGERSPAADRRFAAVRHIAGLFDRYAVHRPAMLQQWFAGEDTSEDGAPLPTDLVWQPELWRRLRARLGAPSPAERLGPACDRLKAAPDLLALGARLSVYGLTRLPASHLEVLQALAVRREVHLLLLHPSPALWRTIAASGDARGPVRRNEDLTAGTAVHPLLRSWGRDARELQLLLPAPAEDGGGVRDVLAGADRAARTPRTLLEQIQADIRDDRASAGQLRFDAEDRSIQVHSCHGRARQVEVLRDTILHLLDADPKLEPRDVIVMCPDVETFAPLIHATFGATEGEAATADRSGTDLQVRLADRALRQTNPLLGLVAALLVLAASRVTASGVLDLAGREPVRRRFRLDDEDLARLQEWIAATGIRWGLDAQHRRAFKLDAVATGTWRAGLDRVLVGVALREEGQHLVGGVLPLDDVDSGEVDLAGRTAELLDRIDMVVAALSEAQTVESWARALAHAVDLLGATPDRDAWQRTQLQRMLDEVVAEATVEGVVSATCLGPAELRDLVADRLRGRPTRAGFRTGHLTVCTLAPMRSVPHRVVCLLGLDDGVFPRRTAPDGDDLVARVPHVGDHDPRSEDRQLLLDALLAASDHLVITYAGRDERTNAPRPPAVPVGELLDVIDVVAPDARDRVVVQHPLQPFDERNFRTGALLSARPWSFDTAALHGAQALSGERRDPPAFLEGPLPPQTTDVIELDALVRFLQHPVKAFLRQRLGIVITETDDEVADALPVELDKLEEWALGQRLLEARLAGADPQRCVAAETARGTLPPGALGRPVIDRVGPLVDGIVAAVADVTGGVPHAAAVEIDLALPGGCALVGAVAGVHDGQVLEVTYSRVAAKHRLAAWVRALALTAAHPDSGCAAVTVGRSDRRHRDVTIARVPAVEGNTEARREDALRHLTVLADLYERGLRAPLPLYCRTSGAFAEAVRVGRSTEAAVRREWESGWRSGWFFTGEDADPEHELVLGRQRTVSELLAEVPCDDESAAGWPDEEPSRVGRYARRLWDPLLDREVVEHR